MNRAEEAYWKASEGSREADSTAILGFDCGGEQLVYEVPKLPLFVLSGLSG